jgi:hypothetical protein
MDPTDLGPMCVLRPERQSEGVVALVVQHALGYGDRSAMKRTPCGWQIRTDEEARLRAERVDVAAELVAVHVDLCAEVRVRGRRVREHDRKRVVDAAWDVERKRRAASGVSIEAQRGVRTHR